MLAAFQRILKNLTPPAAKVDNGNVTVSSMDCSGAAYAVFEVILGAVDIGMTVCKLQEADDNATWSDVAGSHYGTDNNDLNVASTLPASTDSNHIFGWFVDMAGRKRYLQPVITVGNGSTGEFVVVRGELWRNKTGPYLAASAGYTQRIVL